MTIDPERTLVMILELIEVRKAALAEAKQATDRAAEVHSRLVIWRNLLKALIAIESLQSEEQRSLQGLQLEVHKALHDFDEIPF